MLHLSLGLNVCVLGDRDRETDNKISSFLNLQNSEIMEEKVGTGENSVLPQLKQLCCQFSVRAFCITIYMKDGFYCLNVKTTGINEPQVPSTSNILYYLHIIRQSQIGEKAPYNG